MKQQQLNSILASIDAKCDVPKATKQPCFPVPYTVVMVSKPLAGAKRGYIPCVELKNIKGGYELRRCDEIVKPIAKEPIDLYMARLERELMFKEIKGETIL